ncbi:MAG: type II secretion system F family protein [Candidatus Micrarchaeota archaeon]|nr:type II secretion system F family protein [Candidatus Micrarchaeota archaeon]
MKKSILPITGTYYVIVDLLPHAYRTGLKKRLAHAGITMDLELWLGPIILSSLVIGLLCLAVAWGLLDVFDPVLLAASFLAGLLIIIIAAYTLLATQIDERKARVEKVLPDALHIMAANIRTGAPPMIALRMTARPEFGPLEEEIKYVTTKSLGTESFTDALNEMSHRIPSDIFARTVSLIAASLKAGGKLAQLLESVAEDIRETQELKAELVTNSNLYILFIAFTVVIGTPLLLAVSVHFTTMVADLQKAPVAASLSEEVGVNSIGLIISTPFSVTFVENAGYFVILMTNILAGVLMGAIREGKETSGLKYVPFMLIISFIVYFIVKDVILQFLRSAA